MSCDKITSCLNPEDEQEIDYGLSCDLLSYAHTVFTLYIPKDSNVKTIIKNKAIEIINIAKQNNFSRWLVEPSEVISELLESLEYELASDIMEKLQEGADHLSKKEGIAIDDRINNCFIERSLLETSKLFIKFMKLEASEKEKLRKKIHTLIANLMKEKH